MCYTEPNNKVALLEFPLVHSSQHSTFSKAIALLSVCVGVGAKKLPTKEGADNSSSNWSRLFFKGIVEIPLPTILSFFFFL